MKKSKKIETPIKKAILPVAGLGTRFLPLSKVIPKEIFPVVDKPVIQYIVEEAKNSGVSKITFVADNKDNPIINYFKNSEEINNLLKKRGKSKLLKGLKEFQEQFKDISFSYVYQKKPLGDGHAILQAKKEAGEDPFGVLFGDDIVDADPPVLKQLIDVFQTCNSSVIALRRLPKNRLPSYGIVRVEKIANRLYKIKQIVEKPDISEAPSDLAIVGKYVLTPEVFDYLKTVKPSEKGEIVLADVLDKMVEEGKMVYGYEIKGDWLECGDKRKWLKTFMHFALKDPRYGDELKKYIKNLL